MLGAGRVAGAAGRGACSRRRLQMRAEAHRKVNARRGGAALRRGWPQVLGRLKGKAKGGGHEAVDRHQLVEWQLRQLQGSGCECEGGGVG